MANRAKSGADSRILVWDLPTRLFHWLLVGALAGSWLTHEMGLEWTELHMWSGYAALGLVIFRVMWGFVGPAHARFTSFLASPSRTRNYARHWLAGDPPRYTGHNPLGGWAIVVMLALVLVQAVSGLFNSDDIMYAGPWQGSVSKETAELMSEIHAVNFNILLLFVALHLAAIGSYWVRWRVDLLRPMFNGRKPPHMADPDHAITGQRLLVGVIVAGLAATIVWTIVASAPTPTADDFF